MLPINFLVILSAGMKVRETSAIMFFLSFTLSALNNDQGTDVEIDIF